MMGIADPKECLSGPAQHPLHPCRVIPSALAICTQSQLNLFSGCELSRMAAFMSLGAIPVCSAVPGALEAFKRTPTCDRMKCHTPGVIIPDAVCFLVKPVQIVYLRSFN